MYLGAKRRYINTLSFLFFLSSMCQTATYSLHAPLCRHIFVVVLHECFRIIYVNILLNRLQCDLNDAGDVTTTYTKRFKEPSLERMSEADVRLLSHTA